MLRKQVPTHCWHTLYRRYGVNLPSSLTVFHSNALEFSSCPPESVCGTVLQFHRLAAFLVSRGSLSSEPKLTPSHLRINKDPDFPRSSSYMLGLAHPIASTATFLHPRITPLSSTGILTCCPSTTPFGLALGAD